ncbi:MAG: hypothetical protein GC171_15055 [Terrimonas sp.]|nr:hypothetical protein [Terrimonas sp.]
MKYEIEAWKRTLEFIESENIFLLDHLTDLLKRENENSFIETAEHYHNLILDQLENIRKLRHTILEIEKFQWIKLYVDGYNGQAIKMKYKRIRRKVLETEELFRKIKDEFNNRILQGYDWKENE